MRGIVAAIVADDVAGTIHLKGNLGRRRRDLHTSMLSQRSRLLFVW